MRQGLGNFSGKGLYFNKQPLWGTHPSYLWYCVLFSREMNDLCIRSTVHFRIYLQCCDLPFPSHALIPFLLCFQMPDTCSSTSCIQMLSEN